MFHYKLRTLLIVLALGPPVLAIALYVAALFFGAWFDTQWQAEMEIRGF